MGPQAATARGDPSGRGLARCLPGRAAAWDRHAVPEPQRFPGGPSAQGGRCRQGATCRRPDALPGNGGPPSPSRGNSPACHRLGADRGGKGDVPPPDTPPSGDGPPAPFQGLAGRRCRPALRHGAPPRPGAGAAFVRGGREGMERVMGIEPTSSAWKAAALPLSYTRMANRIAWGGRARKRARCRHPVRGALPVWMTASRRRRPPPAPPYREGVGDEGDRR